jgi:ketosteroid isomerase-like protein
MRPSEIAEHYFPSVRARDIERFMALFVEDAVMILPDGRVVAGAAAIREMEQAVFDTGAPMPEPTGTVIGERSVAVEIDVHLPNGAVMKAANFFSAQ